MSFPAVDRVAHPARTRSDAVALASADTGEEVTWRALDDRVLAEALDRNVTGKVSKPALRARYAGV